MTARSRKRRIAADEAHAWARNLRLNNPNAKLLLCMLALYINGEGTCFVGINELAADCELSVNTIRARLKFLEDIGAIARFPQWLDEHGRRTASGKGKRTTDEIRLLYEADSDQIEANAGNGDHTVADDATPPRDGGLTQAVPSSQDSLSPPSALPQPSDSVEVLTLEPEPEPEQPPTPSGGVHSSQDLEEFKSAFVPLYPAPVTDYPRFETIAAALTPEERAQALVGVKGYADFIAEARKKHRDRAVKDAHRWLSGRMWLGYLAKAEQAQEIAATAVDLRFVATDSPEGKAWRVLHKIAQSIPLTAHAGDDYVLKVTLDTRALACARVPPPFQWWVPDRQQAEAWRKFVSESLGKTVASPLKVPWPWPPKADGTPYPVGQSDDGTESQISRESNKSLLTEADEEFLREQNP